MLQIPKNVMQIGEVNPHTKIYMEDYVHTFLERHKKAEEYLAFGKKEERGDVLYYLIYGVEKRTDWDRGSYPYFKKYERIGTIEGAAGRRVFRPVRGSGISLEGYFIFYEQNEDMQSYMIVVREAEEMAGSEEKEEVIEAVRTHREQRKKELEAAEMRRDKEPEEKQRTAAGRAARSEIAAERAEKREGIVQAMQRKAKRNAASAFGKKEKKMSFTMPARTPRQPKHHAWTIPDLCRAGSMILLLLLVVMGLTSINQYPDMKAAAELFSDAVNAVRNKENTVTVDAKTQEDGLVVEEAAAGQEESAEAVMDEAETKDALVPAANPEETIQWMIGQQDAQNSAEEVQRGDTGENGAQQDSAENGKNAQHSVETAGDSGHVEAEEKGNSSLQQDESTEELSETVAAAEDEEEEETVTQAIARPVSYVVKKGDSLAGIARRFYGNASMVKEICNVNQIEDPNQIHPGQNILLP